MRMAKTVQRSLEQAHCDFDVVAHPHSSSSLETARVAGVPAERVAKSVILDDSHGHYLMAVLPASRHLDLSKVRGSNERPRLAVYRSLNHIYAQVVDDLNGQTIVSASTTEKDLRGTTGGNVEAARRIGKAIAERALEKGISSVVFDRGGYLYHGRIKALTDAARAAGLNKDEASAAVEAEPEPEEAVEEKPRKKKEKQSKEKH